MDKKLWVPVATPNKPAKKEFISKEIIIDGKKMMAVVADTSNEEKLSTVIKAIPVDHLNKK